MRYVAFLRGMNVGGHRITNAELCGHIEALGFSDVSAFLASGNVVFDAGRKKNVAARIEKGLKKALGYDVPTVLRTGPDVLEIAARDVFPARLVSTWGKEHVWLLATTPSPTKRDAILQLATKADRLELIGREIHWLPRGSILDSTINLQKIVRLAGTATARTTNTVRRLAKKHFAE